ncbi:BACON domain-containing protein [Alistipes senegalensis]|uniref:BACON domain-containing protein n=1 Tax=Alistipes senegalensis TaxID=1288121 RepID=UPI00242BB6AA|nr:BACON domain-containing carbohydrate-binding protein [Alistipes senegalensis]MDY4569157.1 BACON domain-containing carbohydrate-binding protein [Alistipes senegalensis]
MKRYNLFRHIMRAAAAMALLIPAAALNSCNDDDEAVGGSYLRIENPMVGSNTKEVTRIPSYSELGCEIAPILASKKFSDAPDSLQAHTVSLISYDIRSNRDWTVVVEGDNAEWLRVNPSPIGSGDGRIFLTATNNYSTEARATTLYIRYADGSYSDASLAVTQTANTPYFITRVNGTDTGQITVKQAATTYEISVLSNIDYFYSTEGDFFRLTETGNGLFTLEVDAYPENAQELERSGSIDFKGVGAYASMTGRIVILQTIRPEIAADGLTNNTISFKAEDKTAVSFTVSANYDWSIEIPEQDDWYTVTPLKGLANENVTVLVTPTENTDDKARNGKFTITTEEKMGEKASLAVTVKQASGSSGSGMTGLDAPVSWLFSAANMANYTDAFVKSNLLPANEGTGYISYTHTYLDQTGIDDPDCARFIGSTGQPYITGAWPGDYWLFQVPVTKFEAGTKVRFSGLTRTSATGQNYWLLEFCDGTGDNDWKPVIATQTATVNGEEIIYTHSIPSSNISIDVTVTYTKAIAKGEVRFRMTCVANWKTDGSGALPNPNGGTIRWASTEGTGYTDSPRIEVVD